MPESSIDAIKAALGKKYDPKNVYVISTSPPGYPHEKLGEVEIRGEKKSIYTRKEDVHHAR